MAKTKKIETKEKPKRFRIKDYLRTPIQNTVTVALAEDRSNIEEENDKHIKRFIRQRKSEKRYYRVLIVDFRDSYIGSKISLNDIFSFRNKTAIIGDSKMTKAQRKKLVLDVCSSYKNGLLIIDGCHELELTPADISILLRVTNTCRTFSIDAILGFGNSILNIPNKVLHSVSYVRQHFIKEKATQPKIVKKLSNPQIFEVAQAIALNQYNGEDFVVIDMENHKIFSCTEQEYVDGISGMIIDRASFVTTLKGLEDFPIANATKYFYKQKHIPISNIENGFKEFMLTN